MVGPCISLKTLTCCLTKLSLIKNEDFLYEEDDTQLKILEETNISFLAQLIESQNRPDFFETKKPKKL